MPEAIEKALAKFKAALDAARNSKKTPEQIEKAKELYDSLDPGDRAFLEYIFPEVVESEDERIRKGLIHHLKELREWKAGSMSPIKVKEHYDAWIAYLEKQKEQKPVENPKWYDSMDEFYADALIEMVEKSDLIDIDKKNRLVWIEKHRAMPAEWSEEDKEIIEEAICVLEANFEPNETFSGLDITRCQLVERLKSLRPQPHWKPSEEQMIELRAAISGCSFDTKTLSSLEKDLKKLM